jgi:hypothetical protein
MYQVGRPLPDRTIVGSMAECGRWCLVGDIGGR